MPAIIKLRKDTSANWALANSVLLDGEVGIDLTAKNIKVGNGVTAWNALDYFFDFSGENGGGNSITYDPIEGELQTTVDGQVWAWAARKI